MTRSRGVTYTAMALLAAAFVLVLLLVTGTGSDQYKVTARFTDASQLVKGNVVQVGGRTVGSVTALKLSPDGMADVEMTLHDDSVKPLHQGTRATIRALGLSGVANRFVSLTPGPPTTGEIADGGVIGPDMTKGVVDLDVVLDTLTPRVRKDVQKIIAEAATAITPTSAKQTNAGLHLLNPAASQLSALGAELTSDQAALSSLLGHTSSLAAVLARHRESLGSGIRSTAGVLGAVASERDQLAAALDNAPESLRLTTATLRRIRTRTLPAVDPLVKGARPTVKPLGELLRTAEPTLRNARPVVADLQQLMPEAQRALQPLPRLAAGAAPALKSTSHAIKNALPLITGLRAYTPDLVAGFFTGFGGSTGGYYDANGHYARIALELNPGAVLPGIVQPPPGSALGGYRTGRDARCPGGAEEPAPDRSNPAETDTSLCAPEDDPK